MSDVGTHWDGCYRVHPDCAEAIINRLRQWEAMAHALAEELRLRHEWETPAGRLANCDTCIVLDRYHAMAVADMHASGPVLEVNQ